MDPRIIFARLYVSLQNFSLKREEGQTMAEYGMLVALIAVAAIIGVTAFGGALQGFFTGLPGQLGL
jgi:pilus assembly protein Flp/PilA